LVVVELPEQEVRRRSTLPGFLEDDGGVPLLREGADDGDVDDVARRPLDARHGLVRGPHQILYHVVMLQQVAGAGSDEGAFIASSFERSASTGAPRSIVAWLVPATSDQRLAGHHVRNLGSISSRCRTA